MPGPIALISSPLLCGRTIGRPSLLAIMSSTQLSTSNFDHLSKEQKAITRHILWKLDLYVLPPLALLWLAAFLDRANIGNARIAGLQTDLHLKGNEFNTSLAVFYVPYILIELPSNWILKRMKPNVWLPLLVIVWGIVTTMTGLVQSFGSLVVVRMVLGLCEGGLLPGMVLYLSTLYQREELQLRISLFYASASLSGAFGGLLASAILKLNGRGNLAGWRWIFILEGIASSLVGVLSMFFLPESLKKAKFLTEEERQFAENRFQRENLAAQRAVAPPDARVTGNPSVIEEKEKDSKASIRHVEEAPAVPEGIITQEAEAFEWREVRRGLIDIQTWLTAFAYLGLITSLYSFSLFLPTIVAGLGFSGERAQLTTVPPYVPATVMTIVVAILADRLRWRGPFILICMPFTIAGYILILAAKTNEGRYAATFLIALGVYPSAPCILSILPNNSAGFYKKATTTALQLALANLGAFVATFVYTADQAPTYHKGHSIVLGFTLLTWVLVALNVAYCKWENKARREGRRASNIEKYRDLWDRGLTRAPIGDRSPDFRFIL